MSEAFKRKPALIVEEKPERVIARSSAGLIAKWTYTEIGETNPNKVREDLMNRVDPYALFVVFAENLSWIDAIEAARSRHAKVLALVDITLAQFRGEEKIKEEELLRIIRAMDERKVEVLARKATSPSYLSDWVMSMLLDKSFPTRKIGSLKAE